jgi:hypothetical protein
LTINEGTGGKSESHGKRSKTARERLTEIAL